MYFNLLCSELVTRVFDRCHFVSDLLSYLLLHRATKTGIFSIIIPRFLFRNKNNIKTSVPVRFRRQNKFYLDSVNSATRGANCLRYYTKLYLTRECLDISSSFCTVKLVVNKTS